MTDQHSRWKEINGDETLALDWDITRESLVWEIGGYEGRWVAQMAEKYDPYIDVFEPQQWLAERLQNRFRGDPKIGIYPYGLWVMDAALPLYNYETDGASLMSEGARTQVSPFRDIYRELAETKKIEIDVCLMNIEGSEFVLIPFLIGNDLMRKFRYFWCQFHTFLPLCDQRMETIYEKMTKTHRVLWNHYPTAVAWERRTVSP